MLQNKKREKRFVVSIKNGSNGQRVCQVDKVIINMLGCEHMAHAYYENFDFRHQESENINKNMCFFT